MSDLESDPRETASAPGVTGGGPELLVLDPRVVPLGGVRGITVARTLPHRDLPTVGGWCFLDHFGPDPAPMRVLPHPHIGLQTVTWLFAGEVRHRDSLGSDVVIRAGELNVMTSGDGIAHSELTPASDEAGMSLHGLQLWVALPDERRRGEPAFEHHARLPLVRDGALTARILLGSFDGVTSPATTFSPLLGAQLDLTHGAADCDLDPGFEHAVLVVSGSVTVDGLPIGAGRLVYLGAGRSELALATDGEARLMLLGGPAWTEPLVMWWNFVARDHEEIVAARSDWEAHSTRFGPVEGHAGERIPAPPIPPTRMLPRRRRPT